MSTFDPQAVKEFRLFNIDCGAAMRFNIRSQGRIPTPAEKRAIRKLRGTKLWSFRPLQRTSKVINTDTLTPEQVERRRKREQRARVERLTELCTPEKLDEMEQADQSITDLLPPPEWV